MEKLQTILMNWRTTHGAQQLVYPISTACLLETAVQSASHASIFFAWRTGGLRVGLWCIMFYVPCFMHDEEEQAEVKSLVSHAHTHPSRGWHPVTPALCMHSIASPSGLPCVIIAWYFQLVAC